jgi:uncharacterized protein (TIGR02186 family)
MGRLRWRWPIGAAALSVALAAYATTAGNPGAPEVGTPVEAGLDRPALPGQPPGVVKPQPGYRLEADVLMRSIPVDVRFSGARIVMFGSASRSGPATAGEGPLDIVAVFQGVRSPMMVRRKTRVWGLWLNTTSVAFEQAPRYYAVASTRPLEAIAPNAVLAENGIGLAQVSLPAVAGAAARIDPLNLDDFRAAAIDLGIESKRYIRKDDGISFVGQNLFRGEIDLPAIVPAGQIDVSVFLFRGGKVMMRSDSRVLLAREGFEQWVYQFADRHGFWYGVLTVALAAGIGLLSSFLVSLRR